MDMDKTLRVHFEAFDASERNERGVRQASRGGIREAYFMAGVRAMAGRHGAAPVEAVRTQSELADVVFKVYRGRDIIVIPNNTRAEGYADVRCMHKRYGPDVPRETEYVLRGKSDLILGREIMHCAMIGLSVKVETGEDWQ